MDDVLWTEKFDTVWDPARQKWKHCIGWTPVNAPGFATLPVGHRGSPGLYAGTSISAAYTANVIADYLSKNPSATLQDVQAFIDRRF